VQNLLSIYEAFTGWSGEQMRKRFAGVGYGDLKREVADAVIAGLEPIQQRYRQIAAERGQLANILAEGAARVRQIVGEHHPQGQEGNGVVY
jgi:tryptophanyl-tRNA synthetase